jgi:O-antigen ligase
VVPDATATSLLAGIPLVAAFLVGHACSMSQLKWLARVVILVAFGEVLLGLLQIAGGEKSALYFGMVAAGRPIGTFANSNHFANYLAIALVLYLWLAWKSLVANGNELSRARLAADRHVIALWVGGGVLLMAGILMSRSRGAALSGLPMAVLAMAWLMVSGRRHKFRWAGVAAALAAVLVSAVALLGADFVLSRFGVADVLDSASFRTVLTRTSLEGAAEFWPWGAGWGVYGAVYPRFQPAQIAGAAGHAHQDYVQMLFEGGIFALLYVAAFLWLAVRRAVLLTRLISRNRHLRRETVASTLCGLGLLGFLLHSLVEFNMHIPANAILACLLAGVYLRPLADTVEPT